MRSHYDRLHITKALGIFRKLIITTRRTTFVADLRLKKSAFVYCGLNPYFFSMYAIIIEFGQVV